MALPTIEKTWQISANNACGTATNTMRTLKDRLKGFASSPWTVWGSGSPLSPGYVNNGGGVDHWTADNRLIFSSSAHSWIVLQQAGLGAKTSLLIDLASNSTDYVNYQFSPVNGFGLANGGTDGTSGSPPSATDSWGMAYNSQSGFTDAQGTNWLQVMQSTDGQRTRMFSSVSGVCNSYWIIDKALSSVAHWTNSIVAGGLHQTSLTNVTAPSLLCDPSYPSVFKTRLDGGSYCGGPYTQESFWSNGAISVQGYADDVSGEWPLTGVGLYSNYSNKRGRKGELRDIWWGALPSGSPYPDDGTKRFMQIGSLVVPWGIAAGLVTK